MILANVKATSVMTLLNNLMILTHANQERGCLVGNNRLMEMIAAIDTRIVAFQPPCMPTDWQANQISHFNTTSPHTVYFLGGDLFDLGQRHEADGQPQSLEKDKLTSRLPVRSFLHLWEKQESSKERLGSLIAVSSRTSLLIVLLLRHPNITRRTWL